MGRVEFMVWLVALAFAPACPAWAQSHVVGSEWPCAACSRGQVCFRQNAESTICRTPQGNPDFAGMQASRRAVDAQIAEATARIQRNPRDANAWVSRAAYYLTPSPGGGKPPLEYAEAAVRDLETAIRIDPNNFYARHNYAHVAYLLGYYDFAIAEFNKAIAINPAGSGRSYMGIGFAYFDGCNVDKSPPYFAKAVQLDPTLQSKVAGPARIEARRQECARIAEQLRIAASRPPPTTSMPNVAAMYERNEAMSRANAADAAGDHGAARIIRENARIP